MSRHEGVSCDSCLKGNFTGKRYKCLICYDYDLCATCYEAGAVSTRHSADHPMQCILTRADFDIFFGGETLGSDLHQSYTCPHCGRMGFTDLLLLEHVTAEQCDAAAEVVCPVCAAYQGGDPNRVVEDLGAHLMLEHRTSNTDADAQLSGMRAVRRIPHHGRTVSNPRTRRAANLQYQQSSPGSTLMVLSPGDRDREAMDPIAELLSQLSTVRSRTAAAQSISTQLQQLEMQLHTTRLQADRLSAAHSSDAGSRTLTTITFPPAGEQVATTIPGTDTSGSGGTSKEHSEFLLARLEDEQKAETEQQAAECERADKSLFVQELLLAVLANDKSCDMGEPASEEPAKLVANAASEMAVPVPLKPSSVEPPRSVTENQTSVDRTTASAVLKTGRAVVNTASSLPPVDGRILPNASSVSSRNLTKRKPVQTSTKAGKEASCTGNTVKRH